MVWWEVDAAMIVVLLSKVGAFALVVISGVNAGARLLGIVRRGTMGQVGSEDQDVAGSERHLHPLMSLLPLEGDVPFATGHIHLV